MGERSVVDSLRDGYSHRIDFGSWCVVPDEANSIPILLLVEIHQKYYKAQSIQMIIKTPFYFKSQQSVTRVLTPEVVKSLTEESQVRVKHPLISFQLEKKPVPKGCYHIVARTYVNPADGTTVKVIEQVELIKQVADYSNMPDFSYIPPLNSSDLLTMFKDRIFPFQTGKELKEQFIQCLRPSMFLNKCHLQPPNTDLFEVRDKPLGPRVSGISVKFEEQEIPTESRLKLTEEVQGNHLFGVLKQFFEKRPIWLKNVLLTQLKMLEIELPKMNEIKTYLHYLSYIYKDGPWKNAYVRLGYNPKLMHKSVIYQVITLKLKRKDADDYEEEQQLEQLYDPTFTNLSYEQGKSVRSYQLCDIADNRIREIFESSLASGRNQCEKQYGWLSKNQHRSIGRLMKQRVN